LASREQEDKLKQTFGFLSELCQKFDEMTEHCGLFKVQSDGTTYVVMSDPTALLQSQSADIEIQQTEKLCLLGAEMIQALREMLQEKVAQTDEVAV
jgi:hypothetical protein